MYETCLAKQNQIKHLFATCPTEEAKYKKIIELGKELPRLPENEKIPANFVKGCQSQMYLHSYWSGDVIVFEGESDALISSGLAAILIKVYSGETPETILKCPPTYLEDLGLSASLTPSRASGLYSIHLKMKQDALRLLLERERGKK
jgi:cysteine desulfuration protein SufE